MSIKLEKVFFITNKLGHSILQNYVIQFFIIFAPLLDLNANKGTA